MICRLCPAADRIDVSVIHGIKHRISTAGVPAVIRTDTKTVGNRIFERKESAAEIVGRPTYLFGRERLIVNAKIRHVAAETVRVIIPVTGLDFGYTRVERHVVRAGELSVIVNADGLAIVGLCDESPVIFDRIRHRGGEVVAPLLSAKLFVAVGLNGEIPIVFPRTDGPECVVSSRAGLHERHGGPGCRAGDAESFCCSRRIDVVRAVQTDRLHSVDASIDEDRRVPLRIDETKAREVERTDVFDRFVTNIQLHERFRFQNRGGTAKQTGCRQHQDRFSASISLLHSFISQNEKHTTLFYYGIVYTIFPIFMPQKI